jgi:plasmid stabilization system protein ParE
VRLRVRKLARAEINAAFNWYLERSPRAAERFLEAVDAALKAIESAPKRQPVIRGRLRRLLLKGFPYGVYYKVYPKVISVVGVIHGRRHPATWLRRA